MSQSSATKSSDLPRSRHICPYWGAVTDRGTLSRWQPPGHLVRKLRHSRPRFRVGWDVRFSLPAAPSSMTGVGREAAIRWGPTPGESARNCSFLTAIAARMSTIAGFEPFPVGPYSLCEVSDAKEVRTNSVSESTSYVRFRQVGWTSYDTNSWTNRPARHESLDQSDPPWPAGLWRPSIQSQPDRLKAFPTRDRFQWCGKFPVVRSFDYVAEIRKAVAVAEVGWEEQVRGKADVIAQTLPRRKNCPKE